MTDKIKQQLAQKKVNKNYKENIGFVQKSTGPTGYAVTPYGASPTHRADFLTEVARFKYPTAMRMQRIKRPQP